MKRTVRILEESINSQKNNTFEQNFKIYLRVKPIINEEQTKEAVKILSKKKIQIISPYYSTTQPQKIYSYQEIFNNQVTNLEVFQKTMIVPILNALSGYNSTVFIYGMTGAGKTYTMFGDSSQEGLVGITLDYMFNQIKVKKQVKTQVFVSFFEIYNQNIRDLLEQGSQNLAIMQDPAKGVIINDLKQISIDKQCHAKKIIAQGLQRRSMNATKSNESSSRSHAILQLSIKRYVTMDSDQISVLQSKFFMIDLAGNEKTGYNESKRFIEGININKSLLTLGKCISILAQQKKNSFVPFRDSKLTRILKQSLGGNSKTVMIACISSQKKYYQETLNTLKYSTIAKRIKNKVSRNNVKLISKNQLPDQKQFVAITQNQYGKLKQQLQIAKKENQKYIKIGVNIEQSKKYLQQINYLLNKISNEYNNNMRYAQSLYKDIMNQVSNLQNKQTYNIIQNQRKQILKLHQIISQQQNKIKQLQDRFGKGQNNTQRNLDQSLSINKQNKLKSTNITHRSFSKNRPQLTINFPTVDQSFKANNPLQGRKHQPTQQIIINLNTSQSIKSKEQFVRKLKQTEKKAKGGCIEDISQIIQQQRTYQYDLNSIEQSMLRKLRFFQKERPLQKSHSFGGVNGPRSTSSKKWTNKF